MIFSQLGGLWFAATILWHSNAAAPPELYKRNGDIACRDALTLLDFQKVAALEYGFVLDQAVESRFVSGDFKGLSALADHVPEQPYAHIEGTLYLAPMCSTEKGGDTVFQGRVQDVNVICADGDATQHADCVKRFSRLQEAPMPFWFDLSAHAVVSHVRVDDDEAEQVASLERGLVELLGRSSGNCSAVALPGSLSELTITEQGSGWHGSNPDSQMPFNSLRLHRITGYGPGAPPRTDGQRVVTTAISRAIYTLDGVWFEGIQGLHSTTCVIVFRGGRVLQGYSNEFNIDDGLACG